MAIDNIPLFDPNTDAQQSASVALSETEVLASIREEREGADYEEARTNPRSDYGRRSGEAVVATAIEVTTDNKVEADFLGQLDLFSVEQTAPNESHPTDSKIEPKTYDKSRSPAASAVQYRADQAYWARQKR